MKRDQIKLAFIICCRKPIMFRRPNFSIIYICTYLYSFLMDQVVHSSDDNVTHDVDKVI
jgi:hypothetical protein